MTTMPREMETIAEDVVNSVEFPDDGCHLLAKEVADRAVNQCYQLMSEQLSQKEHPTFTKTIAGFHAEWVIAQNDIRMLNLRIAELERVLRELRFDSEDKMFEENCHGPVSAARLADGINNRIQEALQGGGE